MFWFYNSITNLKNILYAKGKDIDEFMLAVSIFCALNIGSIHNKNYKMCLLCVWTIRNCFLLCVCDEGLSETENEVAISFKL